MILKCTPQGADWFPAWKACMDGLFHLGLALSIGCLLVIVMYVVVSTYQQSN